MEEEQDNDSDDYFSGFKRMATMPVRSVLQKNIEGLNFDEIESCKISGMSSSIKEASQE